MEGTDRRKIHGWMTRWVKLAAEGLNQEAIYSQGTGIGLPL
jgi:hypothetical protein